MMSRLLALLMCVSLGTWGTGVFVVKAHAAPESWAIATSSSGSSPYKIGTNLAKHFTSKVPSVVFSCQASAGFNENLFLVADKEVAIGMIASLDLANAYKQKKQYAGNPQFANLRRMFPYTVEHGHQFVRADSDIREFMDIKGKKFNLNTPASITSMRNDLMLEAFGMSRKDIKPMELATSGAFDAIRDKVVDMSANGLSIGNASLLELSSSVPIRLIAIPEDIFHKFNELMDNSMGYGVILGGTYKGQDEDVWTWIGYNILFTHKDADEEKIYQLTKAFWEHLPELASMDNGFAPLNPDLAIFGPTDVPFHPGVEKYFRGSRLAAIATVAFSYAAL